MVSPRSTAVTVTGTCPVGSCGGGVKVLESM
jgi:hypothetical protein